MEESHACGALFKQIHISLEKHSNAALKEEGLTNSQMEVLMILHDDLNGESTTFKDMEKRLHLAQSTTFGILSRLEKKGLVVTFESPSNRRIRMVQITEEGKLCCSHAVSAMNREEENILRGLTPEERASLLRLLTRVTKNVE